LRFCLEDGTSLVDFSPKGAQPTLRINPPRTNRAVPTEVLHDDAHPPLRATDIRTLLPWTVAGVATILAVLMGIGIFVVFILSYRSSTSAPGANGSNYNQSRPNAVPTKSPQGSPNPINVAGTYWTGRDSTNVNVAVRFSPGGILNDSQTDTWTQSGSTVYWIVNDYAHYQGVINGDHMEFKAYNKVDFHWTGSLTLIR